MSTLHPDYELVVGPPSIDDYCRLRRQSGLSERTPEAAARGLPNTLYGVTVRHGGAVVGMGRIIGDGGCCFEVVDMAVVPAHQRRGLGKSIMGALMAWLRANAPSSSIVTLIADGDASRLYAQCGFRPAAPHAQGMLMIL